MASNEAERFLGDITDPRVRQAFTGIDRADFVAEPLRRRAYVDAPLSIGYEQTISQPSLVAYMTQSLEVEPEHRVLEIGTGSGFQAAVLAGIAREVYTVEVIPELARSAEERLRRLGFANVHVMSRDGHEGWPEHAPYDRVMITAATPALPPAIWDQLRDGGKILAPIGYPVGVQRLVLISRDGDRRKDKSLLSVRFVPFTRK